jgi:P3 major capsid protein
MNNQQSAQSAAQLNKQARALVLANSKNMIQSITNPTLTSTIPGQVVNIPLRPVGLVKRLWIEINFTLAQAASETLTRTPWGPANILSNVILTDLSNYQRINTAGWHLHMVATAKNRAPYGAAFTTDSQVGFGTAFSTVKAPSSITTAQPLRFFYEVPVCYSDTDLRGAIYANVVNATLNLQLTVNANIVCANTADYTLAAYQSSTASLGTITGFSINVYQNYLDQLPMTAKGPVLPALDMSMNYLLNNTALTGLTVGQDFPVPYANFRNFLSTTLIYDQNGTLNAGTDINWLRIQVANFTNIINIDPFMQQLLTRLRIGDDAVLGSYYFDHRDAPIVTQQQGNTQLVVNPSSVAASSSVLVGWEAMAFANMLTQAGSLAAS